MRLRAGRLGRAAPEPADRRRDLASRTCSRTSRDVAPDVLAVDSIQTVLDPDRPGVPGSVTPGARVRAPARPPGEGPRIATLLVGHVTKDGSLAGPRTLEHLVDTVLAFEGDRHHALRMLHALKHRYGSTNELGLFAMEEAGLADVSDPSALFLADRRPGLPGSVVTAVLEGARPLLVEVQALVMTTDAPGDRRRSSQGLDGEPARDAARGARSSAPGCPVGRMPTCTRASRAGSGSRTPAPTSRSRSPSPARGPAPRCRRARRGR